MDAAGREKRPGREAGVGEVLGDGIGCGEVYADGAAPVAFLVESERGLVAVLVEVAHAKAAAGAQADPSVEVRLEDGAIAVGEDALAGRQRHELARTRGGERAGFLAGIARGARNELRVGGVGHNDRQPELGGRTAQELVEGRERGDPPVDGLGGRVLVEQVLAEVEHMADRDLEHRARIVGPGPAPELDESHHVIAIGALRVRALAPVDPELEERGDVGGKLLELRLDGRRGAAVENRQGSTQHTCQTATSIAGSVIC